MLEFELEYGEWNWNIGIKIYAGKRHGVVGIEIYLGKKNVGIGIGIVEVELEYWN